MERIVCKACNSDKTDLLRSDCETCGHKADTTLNLSGWRQLPKVDQEKKKNKVKRNLIQRFLSSIRPASRVF